jgi:hypothetical protein
MLVLHCCIWSFGLDSRRVDTIIDDCSLALKEGHCIYKALPQGPRTSTNPYDW